MDNSDLGIDISKLTPEDIGMRVCYVPQSARHGGVDGWCGHKDTMWGTISSWNDRFIHVQFGNEPNAQACNPKDLLPDHLSNYARRIKI